MKTNNTPYVKKYENGILVNPITKENPYLFGKEKIKSTVKFWATIKNQFFKGKTIVRM